MKYSCYKIVFVRSNLFCMIQKVFLSKICLDAYLRAVHKFIYIYEHNKFKCCLTTRNKVKVKSKFDIIDEICVVWASINEIRNNMCAFRTICPGIQVRSTPYLVEGALYSLLCRCGAVVFVAAVIVLVRLGYCVFCAGVVQWRFEAVIVLKLSWHMVLLCTLIHSLRYSFLYNLFSFSQKGEITWTLLGALEEITDSKYKMGNCQF